MSVLVPGEFRPGDQQLPAWMLRAKVRPYILRREKDDVLADLPTITFKTERVRMEAGQRAAYEKAVITRDRGANPLSVFNALRTLCDYDPETGASGKLGRVVELLRDICGNRGEKAVVFSYLLEPLRLLRRRLSETDVRWCGIYEGALNIDEANHDGENVSRDAGGDCVARVTARGG